MKIIVEHASYGCDTGCCGHVVRMEDEQGKELRERFEFDHPYGLLTMPQGEERDKVARQFAERLVREMFGEEHVADLDWENCVVLDD